MAECFCPSAQVRCVPAIAGRTFEERCTRQLAGLALFACALALFSDVASAQAGEHPFRGRIAHAARLFAPSATCLESVGKALLDLRRNLTSQDIVPDRFIQSPYLSITASKPERSGKLGTYHFHLAIDPYDNACRLFDSEGGSPSVPGCECVLEDPAAAAQPFGAHRSVLVQAGRTRALAEACAASRNPLGGQLAQYRSALVKYARFKTELPDKRHKAGKKPGLQEQRDAADYSRALRDIEGGSFDEKAYADQRAKLVGVKGGELDQVCEGAGNMLVERIMSQAIEMKTAGDQYRGRPAFPWRAFSPMAHSAR